MRSESHGSSNGPIERKGTVAIGQSVFYTDFPPKEYGQSGKFSLILLFCKFTCIVSHIHNVDGIFTLFYILV